MKKTLNLSVAAGIIIGMLGFSGPMIDDALAKKGVEGTGEYICHVDKNGGCSIQWASGGSPNAHLRNHRDRVDDKDDYICKEDFEVLAGLEGNPCICRTNIKQDDKEDWCLSRR